ncbi:MAG: helix-turn-helix domain-containing protein [Streptosporangiaceae bacterium]
MAQGAPPTVRQRRLAAELRRLRELAEMTGEDAAARLGWSASKVSRIETHRTGVKATDLNRLLDLYRVGGTHRAELLALAARSRSRGWWEAYSDALPEQYATYIVLEAEARSALYWSPQTVHGLFQTPDYAREVIAAHMASTVTIPRGEVEQRVKTRLRRQAILSGDSPLSLSVVLDQSVLLRRFGTDSVMRDQLAHLAEASRQPNIRLQILPLDGRHPIGTGAFTILKFGDLPGVNVSADVVYLEQLTPSALYVEDENETFQYSQAFERLSDAALDPADSRDLVTRTAGEVWA